MLLVARHRLSPGGRRRRFRQEVLQAREGLDRRPARRGLKIQGAGGARRASDDLGIQRSPLQYLS